MWKRASASRNAAKLPTASSTAAAASAIASRSSASARSAASAAASPETARRQSVSSRSSAARRGRGAGDERARRILAHERAPVAPAPRLDEAGLAQDLQRLAQRHRRDAELRGELDLARQPLARRQDARTDRLAQAPHDLLDGALGLQRSERDLARVRPIT